MSTPLAGHFERRRETVLAVKHMGDYEETATRIREIGAHRTHLVFAIIEKPPIRLDIATPAGDLEVRAGDWIVFSRDHVAVLEDHAFRETYVTTNGGDGP